MQLCRKRLEGAVSSRQQQGYVLLALLLIMCLLAIGAAIAAPTIAFRIKRDREEEFIHRGVQYSRAVKRFVKSTGRYPLTIQDLYAGNPKYLRKAYKDPISGKDFKLLHTFDIMSATAANVPQNGASVQPDGTIGNGDQNADANSGTPQAAPPNSSNGVTNLASPNAPATGLSATPPAHLGNDDPTRGVFFGVVSTSKDKTIREFEHKNHYNQWLFFYDNAHDTGRAINGPTPLTMPAPAGMGQPAGGIGQQPGFGQQSGFGQQPGFGQSPGGNQQQPSAPTTQQ